MWSLGGSLFGLLFAGAPIGIALAGATALLVTFDDSCIRYGLDVSCCFYTVY